jgi:hypothetical protein
VVRVYIIVSILLLTSVLVACAGDSKTEKSPDLSSDTVKVLGTQIADSITQTVKTPNQKLLDTYLADSRRIYDLVMREEEIARNMPWDTAAQISAYEAQTQKVKGLREQLRGLTPPPCLADAHRSLVLATLQFDQAEAQTVRGLRQQSAATLNQAADQIRVATAELNKSTNLTNAVAANIESCR